MNNILIIATKCNITVTNMCRFMLVRDPRELMRVTRDLFHRVFDNTRV